MAQKYVFLLIVLLLAGCGGEDFNFSDTPTLVLKDMQQYKLNGKDSAVEILLDYTDGDGDIGLETGDTFAPYQYNGPYFYNLHIYVFEVKNGVRQPVLKPDNDTANFNDRISNLTPTGKNKAIFGTMKLSISAEPYIGITPDSMFYRIFIYDRHLHRSNVIETPVKEFKF